ncbi:MAG TPA: carotenoid oxygenase, partial [Gammaproteobacteria bacterium]|nr:carotenoid oxygenase [Gammaproteobacteria bacterium]
MQRREFSRLSALLAGLTVLGPNALLAGVSASWPGREEKPWLLGFRGVDRDAYQSRPQVTGRIPANLIGTLYRNGPAQHEVAGFRYGHW